MLTSETSISTSKRVRVALEQGSETSTRSLPVGFIPGLEIATRTAGERERF
jgi:hypothetical protein